MQIRTATPADLDKITNIEAECFPAADAVFGYGLKFLAPDFLGNLLD